MTGLVDRTYPDVVRDVLTNLTSGVTGELHRIPHYDPAARPVQVPDVTLLRRPVRRVSRVAGTVAGPGGDQAPYVFTLTDYELVPAADDPADLNTIRFLPFGRKPAPETDLTVSYYPRNVEPSPITDVNVGSVARTLVEALGKELAVVYAQLNLAYDSAFLETAAGSSLDRVVALLGLTRNRAGRPVGTVRFGRRANSRGTISIPPGTPVTDAQDTIRYETVDAHTMLETESTAEVRVRGAADDTPPVGPGQLTVVQRAIAGIDTVTNEQGTARATVDESDAELRARGRSAVTASTTGTVSALENGLLQLPEVRAVSVEEFPNGVAGEVRVSISLADPSRTSLPPEILTRIDELRPAGVRIVPATAATTALQARVALVLAGSTLPSSEVASLHEGVRAQVVALVEKAGVGGRIRTGPIVGALLADERIVDATLRLGPKGGTPGAAGADFQPPSDTIVELAADDVAFEPETFDRPASGAPPVAVEVTAVVPATPVAGIELTAVQSQVEARVRAYVAALSAGETVDADAVLNALRDDSKYAIDALGLRVGFAAGDQFVQVAQGGPAFTVQPGQSFTVVSVQTTAGAA